MAMKCPECRSEKSKVYDSRMVLGGNIIQRRRECANGHRWATLEITHDDDLQSALEQMYEVKRAHAERAKQENSE